MSPRPSHPWLGSRYELIQEIGAGSSGQVWLARFRDLDGALKRPLRRDRTPAETLVAAKILFPALTSDPQIVARFVQERTVLLELSHPNIVKVLDLVVEGDRIAIVMEYVPGGNLATVLQQQQTLSAATAVPIVATVLDALAAAHASGVLHRDVKPANVLRTRSDELGSDVLKLSDFGIASIIDSAAPHHTAQLGTPAYMAPELFEQGLASAASDVYAAGSLLYELLAGRAPFVGSGGAAAVMYRQVNAQPPPLGIHPSLWQVLEVMLQKEAGYRLTAAKTAQQLRALPAAAFTETPLPLQPPPLEWVTLTHREVTPVVVQGLAGDVDVGATLRAGVDELPVEPSAATPAPIEAAPVDLDPVLRGAVGLDATLLKPLLEPDAADSSAELAPVSTKRRWLIAGAGVLVALLGVLLIVRALTREPDPVSNPVPTVTAAVASLSGEPSPSGLRIDLSASVDLASGATELTANIAAPRSGGLQGAVLLVIPGASTECPSIAGSVSPIQESSSGVNAECAYQVQVSLAPGGSQTVRMEVQGDVGPDLDGWLSSIAQSTDEALRALTGNGFALQRITGLQVETADVVRRESTPSVTYLVYPVWSSGVDNAELFRSDTLDYQTTDLMNQLSGGVGLAAVQIDSCAETRVRGSRVIAEQTTADCFIRVSVGDLVSNDARFSISGGS